MGHLTTEQIKEMGFLSVGKNPQLSDRASYYGCPRIRIGDHVRVDDFCVISAGTGGVEIQNNVHIGVYVSLIGAGRIFVSSFCGISSRVSVYSSNDDYSGKYLTGPTVPVEFTKVNHAEVFFGKHVIVGSGAVILPGIALEDGVAIGALSLVNKDCEAFSVYAGIPAQKIGERDRDLLELEKQLLIRKIKK